MSIKDFINADGISFSYPEYEGNIPRTILKELSVSVKEGEFVAVLGHNGSGKSTLAKHFNAILIPNEGKVTVNGIDTSDETRVYDIRKQVGMVFQNPDNQIVATVVEDDVAFALENLGIEPSEIRKRVDDALKKVGMYEYRLNSPDQLSGGQKQRVAIAGIIAMQPRCIVLDEPTAMLDPKGRKEVLSTIHELNREFGITVVLITHYMDEAAQCDRIIIVNDGVILTSGSPKDVFSDVEVLKDIRLDVPQVTELCYELRKSGIDVPSNIITEDECVLAIEKLLKGGESFV